MLRQLFRLDHDLDALQMRREALAWPCTLAVRIPAALRDLGAYSDDAGRLFQSEARQVGGRSAPSD